MKNLVASPEWLALSPVVHDVEWGLRMLPKLARQETFLAHALE
jgi:hypothetical protein